MDNEYLEVETYGSNGCYIVVVDETEPSDLGTGSERTDTERTLEQWAEMDNEYLEAAYECCIDVANEPEPSDLGTGSERTDTERTLEQRTGVTHDWYGSDIARIDRITAMVRCNNRSEVISGDDNAANHGCDSIAIDDVTTVEERTLDVSQVTPSRHSPLYSFEPWMECGESGREVTSLSFACQEPRVCVPSLTLHVCALCDKSFLSKHHLKRHKLTHTGQKLTHTGQKLTHTGQKLTHTGQKLTHTGQTSCL